MDKHIGLDLRLTSQRLKLNNLWFWWMGCIGN